MPLLTPILDDRSYQQLRDELVRRIPVYTEEWTDHNASDPGITLIELFAFLGENLLYRFNQIPDATRLEFLRLLQIPLRPASAARCQIELSAAPDGGAVVPRLTPALAGAVYFETQDEVDALPFEVQARVKVAGPEPTDPHLKDFALLAIDAHGLARNEAPAWYTSQTLPKDPSVPDATPIDLGTAVDHLLWVAVLRPKSAGPVEPGAPAIPQPLRAKTLSLGVTFDATLNPGETVQACPGPEAVTPPAPPVIWQVSLGGLVDARTPPRYRALSLPADSTRGLTQSGVVKLALPSYDVGTFQLADPHLAGTGDLPPGIDDSDVAGRVLFWLRAGRPANAGSAPLGRLRWLAVNAVEVVQSRLAATEFLGTGTAEADQVYGLTHWPVIEGSLVLQVEETSGWRTWSAVDSFAASGEDDRVYVLDLESGRVRFGGLQGRAPQIGERIRAVEYHYGGGVEGNVAAKAISRLEPPAGHPDIGLLKAGNPLPAAGGAPAEAIADGLDRIPGELRRRDRAVTMFDFSELALQTPGALVGRAEPLPLFHPDRPDNEEAAGVVSVVVWPREDRKHPDAPMPDRVLIRDVCAWLDSRRLVTTELHVIPPVYRRIAVSVGIKVKDGYGIDGVRQWVELVLRQYLAPLPPFGPDGQGWPLRRRVHAPELEAAVLQVEGVDWVEKVRLAEWDTAGSSWPERTPIEMGKREVPELAAIAVVADPSPPAPGDPVVPDSGDPTKIIPIPVEQVGCA